jgi:hypothetical protein
MPIRQNGYFNDPAFAQAASNLAQMFAPPSGSDAAGWAAANAKNAEAQRLADFYTLSKDPNADRSALDRAGIGSGSYTPSQSYYSVDQGTAAQRYGYDTQARTSRANNADDNVRALEDRRLQEEGLNGRNSADNGNAITLKMLDPVPDGATRFNPPKIADMYSVPQTQIGVVSPAQGERAFLPDGRVLEGPAKPLTETEWKAQQNQIALDKGLLSSQDIADVVTGTQTPVQVVGPDGAPIYSTPGAAARNGAQAYVNKGAQAKPTNGTALLSDGTQVPAVQGDDGVWRHAQSGQPLPADVKIFDMSKATGTADEVGLTKPVNTSLQQQIIDISVAKDTAVALRDLIAKNPASQGMVGWLRGTTQNFIQSGSEVARQFGGQVEEIQKRIASNLEDNSLGGSFDNNIPAIDMMANLLAFQYAKTTTGERLSNEMLKASRKALGLEGLDANQSNSIARLNVAIERIQAQEGMLNSALKGGVGAISKPAPDAPVVDTNITTSAPAASAAPKFVRDANNNIVRAQ